MIVAKGYIGGAPAFREPPDRDPGERLRIRAAQLVGEDRALMALYLEGGNSYRQIARLTGQYPTSVARRIRRITRRLLDETYPLCLQNRAAFSVFELAVIKDHLARGFSYREICHRRHASLYRIQSIVLAARRFAASLSPDRVPAPQRSNQL